MVRPKASDRNKTLAGCFADIVTVEQPHDHTVVDEEGSSPVACKGPKSIYAALAICLPSILRAPWSQAMTNRTGITEVELNKVLISRGFKTCRRRRLHETPIIWHRQWEGRRWVNCKNPDGISMERSKNGSCFFEDILHVRHVTSDCNIPPKIDVTRVCDEGVAVLRRRE